MAQPYKNVAELEKLSTQELQDYKDGLEAEAADTIPWKIAVAAAKAALALREDHDG